MQTDGHVVGLILDNLARAYFPSQSVLQQTSRVDAECGLGWHRRPATDMGRDCTAPAPAPEVEVVRACLGRPLRSPRPREMCSLPLGMAGVISQHDCRFDGPRGRHHGRCDFHHRAALCVV